MLQVEPTGPRGCNGAIGSDRNVAVAASEPFAWWLHSRQDLAHVHDMLASNCRFRRYIVSRSDTLLRLALRGMTLNN